MRNEIPAWVVEYNNAGHQSSAGKAVKILIDKIKTLEQVKAEERKKGWNEAIEEAILKKVTISTENNSYDVVELSELQKLKKV